VSGLDVVDVEVEVNLLWRPIGPLGRDMVGRKLDAQPPFAINKDAVPVTVWVDRAAEQRSPERALSRQVRRVENDDLPSDLHTVILSPTIKRKACLPEGLARDYIAFDTRALPDSFAVEIVTEIGHGLDEETRAARKAVADASHAQRVAAAQAREAARELRAAGLSGRDIAKVLDVSPQRVPQLLTRDS
jgi:hypothetical protein